jgi:subtilisin family serine protease
MKHFALTIVLLLQYTMFSQKNCNTYFKAQLTDGVLPEKINVLVKAHMPSLLKNQDLLHLKVNYYAGDVASIAINTDHVEALLKSGFVSYLEYQPNHYTLLNDTAMVKNRIKPVKQGALPLAQAYDGTGVIVGIIDSGIDFSHPDFKDSNGNTRIQFIWDQNQSAGSTVPQPFNYGIEWTAAQINASLCTHSDLAQYGHGTHVSGTAAGNGLANGMHEGAAPKADIIVVSLNFGNTTNPIYADAINYIFTKATAAGKPCVINASVGNYYGSHDGTDLQAQLIDNLLSAQNGRALVAAAGNAGHIKFHAKTSVNNDTAFTWLTKNTANIYYWFYADTNDIKNVQTAVGVNRPSSSDLGRIPFHGYTYGLSGLMTDTLKHNGNRIGIVRSYASINAFGVYERLYHIIADTLNYRWRIESKGTGVHDAWNFDFVSNALPSTLVYPYMSKYVMPDTISSIVSSFQCSNKVITVGNYINLNRYFDVTNTLQTTPEIPGKIKETSSNGPTRVNLMKPDVVATGANVFSAMALGMQANLVTNLPSAVSQGSMHVQGGGTSAASPVVAGLVALYFQAYPNANYQQVKQAVINCTYSDGFTGTLPNIVYGYGKLDGMGAMTCNIFTSLQNNVLSEGVTAYPNPFTEKIRIQLHEKKCTIQVYNAAGSLLYEGFAEDENYTISKNMIQHYQGLILVKILGENTLRSVKLMSH